MSSVCVFEFDHPDLVYQSGEEIRGRAYLTLTHPKNVKSAYVEFVGDAWVSIPYHKHRSISQLKDESPNNDEHFGHECYVKTRMVVFKGSVLSAGEHVFPFFVQLPGDCPSSCQAKVGSIRYKLRLVLERSVKRNQNFSQVIQVIRPLDCNRIKELREPVKSSDSMPLGLWSPSNLVVSLAVPQVGYVPGQSIEFTITTENKSSREDFSKVLDMKFKERYSYTVLQPRKRINIHNSTRLLASSRIPLQCRHLSHCVLTGSIAIPDALLPSSPDGIVARTYELQLVLRQPTFGKKQKIKIPIVIGTQPIQQSHFKNSLRF